MEKCGETGQMDADTFKVQKTFFKIIFPEKIALIHSSKHLKTTSQRCPLLRFDRNRPVIYHPNQSEIYSVKKYFQSIFRLAFPERPEAKLDALIEKLRNVEKTSGTIRKCHFTPAPII